MTARTKACHCICTKIFGQGCKVRLHYVLFWKLFYASFVLRSADNIIPSPLVEMMVVQLSLFGPLYPALCQVCFCS